MIKKVAFFPLTRSGTELPYDNRERTTVEALAENYWIGYIYFVVVEPRIMPTLKMNK